MAASATDWLTPVETEVVTRCSRHGFRCHEAGRSEVNFVFMVNIARPAPEADDCMESSADKDDEGLEQSLASVHPWACRPVHCQHCKTLHTLVTMCRMYVWQERQQMSLHLHMFAEIEPNIEDDELFLCLAS